MEFGLNVWCWFVWLMNVGFVLIRWVWMLLILVLFIWLLFTCDFNCWFICFVSLSLIVIICWYDCVELFGWFYWCFGFCRFWVDWLCFDFGWYCVCWTWLCVNCLLSGFPCVLVLGLFYLVKLFVVLAVVLLELIVWVVILDCLLVLILY